MCIAELTIEKMAKEYSIKEIVKTIVVTKQLQKINFQIRHPENVCHIIGIAVTSNLISDPVNSVMTVDSDGNPISIPDPDKGNTAGYLALSIAQKGDVIYSEDVSLDNNDYSDIPEKNLSNYYANIGQSAKHDKYLKTCIKTDKSVVEGYYEDTYSPNLSIEGSYTPKPYLYNVNIYIRYKVFQNESKEQKP